MVAMVAMVAMAAMAARTGEDTTQQGGGLRSHGLALSP